MISGISDWHLSFNSMKCVHIKYKIIEFNIKHEIKTIFKYLFFEIIYLTFYDYKLCLNSFCICTSTSRSHDLWTQRTISAFLRNSKKGISDTCTKLNFDNKLKSFWIRSHLWSGMPRGGVGGVTPWNFVGKKISRWSLLPPQIFEILRVSPAPGMR
jgi:hypothetical protein